MAGCIKMILVKWNDLRKYFYYYPYWKYYYNYYLNNPPPRRFNLPGIEDRDNAVPGLITAVIALSLGLAVLIFNNSDKLEPIIEWLLGILAITCAYSALWMLAYYCTGSSSPHLGFYTIVHLLMNPGLYGPYWFLGLIFAAYFVALIIELVIGMLPLWP